MNLEEKIRSKRARVGVVGIGYTGLPLAMEFVAQGFRVDAIDTNPAVVRNLGRGISHVQDVKNETLRAALKSGRFQVRSDYRTVPRLDCIVICVPTPLRQTKDPDMSHIADACRNIRPHIHEQMLIILQSTTYPGTTEEILAHEFGGDDLKIGSDLFVAFSPERIDPGNRIFNARNTPKIVGGMTPKCTEIACKLYRQIIEQVVPVSSAGTAEMVKLLENTFRAVNIGLVNEIAIMCAKLGISVWEVIEAAATKPFGFMPFYPGPGLGGHCIPVDPLYLSWKLKMLNYNARFIELASEVNTQMPEYCVHRIVEALNEQGRPVRGTRVLILGLTYKKDVADLRESPALDMVRLLDRLGARVDYSDPYVPEMEMNGVKKKSVRLTPASVGRFGLVVVVTDHTDFDYQMIRRAASRIFDTRNVYHRKYKNVLTL